MPRCGILTIFVMGASSSEHVITDRRDLSDETVDYDLGAAARSDRFDRPSHIGRYVVLDLLGMGGMGIVCTAYDPKLDRKVALKLLREGPSPDESATMSAGKARLFREAQALAKLNHPNVIQVHDVDTFEGQLYIAMEYVEGKSLKEWFQEKRRPWREVLGVFLDAGRGLAAAHQADIIHRDFKPGNVLLGDDGRVRVLDFGLAKTPTDETEPIPPRRETGEEMPPLENRGILEMMRSATDLTLTQAGRSVGTPAYMAPEQHLGLDVGPFTDQFSFCVSLWEGLYGELPFSGATIDEQFRNVVEGMVRQPPKNADVPAWLHKVLLRGLRPQTRERWPDMHSLLSALSRDPARRIKLLSAAAAVVLAVGAGGYSVAQAQGERVALCAAGEDKIARVWSDARSEQIRQAFLATDLSYAADAYDRAASQLGERATQWSQAYQEVCEATHMRGEQSANLLDLRMACLNEQLAAFDTLAGVFGEADKDVVERAVTAVHSLGDPSSCASREPGSGDGLPEDPAAREAVTRIAEQIAKAQALDSAGRYEPALEQIRPLVEEARKVSHGPTLARALIQEAQSYRHAGEVDKDEATLREAALAAAAARAFDLETRAWTAMLFSVGQGARRIDDARQILFAAEAAVARGGHDPAAVHLLRSFEGAMHESAGDLKQARVAYEAALAVEGVAPLARTHDLMNYATILAQSGEIEKAETTLAEVVATYEAELGPGHPDLATALHNLGNARLVAKKTKAAESALERALNIRRAALPPGHPATAKTLMSLGVVYKRNEDYEQAIAVYEQAARIWGWPDGEPHADLASVLNNLGKAHLAQENYAEAVEVLTRGEEVARDKLGDTHARRLSALSNLTQALWMAGEVDRALQVSTTALEVARLKSEGKPSRAWATALSDRSKVLIVAGRHGEAVRVLAQARDVLAGTPDDSPLRRVALDMLEARALWGEGKKEPARARARAAAEAARRAQAPETVAEIEAWLANPTIRPAAD